jgi:hypothetical protein
MAFGAGKSRVLRAGALAAAAAVLVIAVPSAGSAAPGGPAGSRGAALAGGDPPGDVARLQARANALSRQYRGQLVLLTGAQSEARARVAEAARLHRQLAHAHRDLARLAALSYMSGTVDPSVAMLAAGGDPRRMLEASATVQYVAHQRGLKEQALRQFLARERQARQTAQDRVARLRRLVAALTRQRRQVAALLTRFHPQSPVIGPNVTPRMLQVKSAIDGRFGPFSAIGCYRPEASGEHPLGRACDFMLSTGGVMPASADVQRGYALAAWAQANASRLGIMYIIYRQRIWDIRMASAGWVPMADRGSVTANHYDHVHISVF